MWVVRHGNKILLASRSPRRKELLTRCGLEILVEHPNEDEPLVAGESVSAMVQRLARKKANDLAERFTDMWIIGADTVVVAGDEILGKPKDDRDALRMMSKLSGAVHNVWGGIAVVCKTRGVEVVKGVSSEVEMIKLSEAQINAYIASGEPRDKAGAYAIQGLAAAFVSRISGSYTNIVGLDLALTLSILLKHGVIVERMSS